MIGPVLDAADVSLGLQYLTAFGVLVVTDDVAAPAVPVAVEAAGFAGAHLVLLVSGDPSSGAAALTLPPDATVLAVPADDEGAFATLVGAYAAALDFGAEPAAAFAGAVGDGRRGGSARRRPELQQAQLRVAGLRLARLEARDELRPVVADVVHERRDGVGGEGDVVARLEEGAQLARVAHGGIEPRGPRRPAGSPPASGCGSGP